MTRLTTEQEVFVATTCPLTQSLAEEHAKRVFVLRREHENTCTSAMHVQFTKILRSI